MAVAGYMTNPRTRIRNSTLHNQLVCAKKSIEKDSNIAQRRLNERSRECVDILNKLKDDSKRLSQVGSYWEKKDDKMSDIGKPAKNTKRATSAPLRTTTREVRPAGRKRPKTAKSAHVLKFEKIESLVPDMEVFQVLCHKIKEPVYKKTFLSTARDFVPTNMNKFDDAAEWSDVLRAADWLNSSSKLGYERRLDIKTPLVVAEFTEKQDMNVLSENVEKRTKVFDERNVDEVKPPPGNAEQASKNTERRLRCANALRRVMRMSGAVAGLSRQSSVNLEQMLKTHEREMRNSGLRTALESTSQLQQAKVLQHISGMEPVSERDLKQKILSAQNALQKDMEAAKKGKQKYHEKMQEIGEKTKTVSFKNYAMPVDNTREKIPRISVVSSDTESEDCDVLTSPVLPTVRINDEMEKRVASYLERNVPKPMKKDSVNKKVSVVSKSKEEVRIEEDNADTALSRRNLREISLERFKEDRRQEQVRRLIELDDERRVQAASTTLRSLMNLLRAAQHKAERLKLSRKELDMSLERVDKRRQPPIKIVYGDNHQSAINVLTR